MPESFDTEVFNPSISTSNNRFSSGQGYSYDANGNVTQDATGQRFGYDAENHQKEFFLSTNSGSTPDATYAYDGDGKRIKKIAGSEVTIFVYDAGGKLVAEYTAQIASSPTISYLTTDSLGSPRVITDNSGAVISRRDFMPFGEEIYAGTANRTEVAKYSLVGMDNVRKRFTGYEKDSETGLDFAEARYYDNRYGRFTAVDPLLASGKSVDPQTFNRYVYVGNSPTNLTDPTGMDWWENRSSSGFPFMELDTNIDVYAANYGWRPPPTYTSDLRVFVKTTTTYTVTAEYDQQIATTTATVVEEALYTEGNTYPSYSSWISSTAAPTNTGTKQYSQVNLDKFQRAVNSIVFNAMDMKFDVALALAIAQKETIFGMYPSSEGAARKQSPINPMQASGGTAIAPGGKVSDLQALDHNVRAAMTTYNGKGKANMRSNLEAYRGSGNATVDSAYATDVIGNYNNIRSRMTVDTSRTRFVQFGNLLPVHIRLMMQTH